MGTFNKSPLGIRDFVKFPFLEESMEFIKERAKNLRVDELDKAEFNELIEKVEKRIALSIRNGIAPIFDDMYTDIFSELLSFIISLIVIKATDDPSLISRYSLAEARRAEVLLKDELKGDKESFTILEYMFKRTTGSELLCGDAPLLFKLHVTDYLRLASQFQSPSWKLTNRVLEGGYVYLKDKEVIRLIREGVYRLLINKINSLPTPVLSPKLREIANRAREEMPPIQKRTATIPKDYPPCINFLLSKINNGENVSHFGRFFLTTYLLAAGWGIENIVRLFSRLPDFKENITKYQVEHIAGLRGGRKKYSIPSCKLIASYGLCFKDENCRDLRNPARYRKKG